MNLQKETSNNLAAIVTNQIDEIITKGLSLKGYNFDNKAELIFFIKQRCKEVKFDTGNKIYYVEDIPFLEFIKYDHSSIFNNSKDNSICFNALIGTYRYL